MGVGLYSLDGKVLFFNQKAIQNSGGKAEDYVVELKNDEFKPEYISQLNTYVSYNKSEVIQKGDNLHVGILLYTNKRKKLVEYATAGMDNTLFVSQYLLQLPQRKN